MAGLQPTQSLHLGPDVRGPLGERLALRQPLLPADLASRPAIAGADEPLVEGGELTSECPRRRVARAAFALHTGQRNEVWRVEVSEDQVSDSVVGVMCRDRGAEQPPWGGPGHT